MILNEEQRAVLSLAIDIYDVDNQIYQAIEEMSELIKALLKLRRVDPDDKKEIVKRTWDIEEETADVAIMIAQLEMIFDAGHIQSVVNKKIKRLAHRLHEEV